MDIVDRHFAAENAHDVAATLATYTDDIVWDDVTHPLSPVHGKDAVGAVYTDIIAAIPDVHFETFRRFTSEDGAWVLDISNVTGHVEGEWAGAVGGGAPVEMRILHLFEVRDGLIAYENTWFDSAAVARQVEAWKAQQGPGPASTPRLNAIGVIVSDLGRAIDFYRRAGLHFTADADGVHAEATGPGGVRIMLDTEASVMSFSDWQPPTGGGPRTALAFLCDSPAEVDRVFEQLVSAGGRSHLPPFDAPWAQRYATVHDPDGNAVDLFAPL